MSQPKQPKHNIVNVFVTFEVVKRKLLNNNIKEIRVKLYRRCLLKVQIVLATLNFFK